MNDWIPCFYAVVLITAGSATAATLGYMLGRWREQLFLLEICKPQH
jgi:membrane protein DedA with SNARE-associated domain